VSRALRIYDLLNKLPFATSLSGKIVLAVVVSVLLPVTAMEVYFICFSSLTGRELEYAILISGITSALAAVLAYWTLSTILKPVLVTARQLHEFLNHQVMPDLPMNYNDEVGNLMSNINYLARRTRDLSERANLNASVDHLTGAYNRRNTESRLRDSIELARVRQTNLSFAILDIDHFKKLNDSYGHDFGDLVLRRIGELLRGNIRRTDWVGRWGGDEFVIALEGGEREASAMLTRICEMARQEFFVAPDKTVHRVSFSCGVCEWQDFMDAQVLFTKADEALYGAKRAGRDQIQVYTDFATA
jgi:diguanylate cyclase (GGDEF)-like protein